MNLIEILIDSVHEKNLLEEASSIGKGADSLSGWRGPGVAAPWGLPGRTLELLASILKAAEISDEFRKKVFQPGYPAAIGKVGYMSDIDLKYAISGGFNCAALLADYMEKYCGLQRNANVLDFGCGTLRISRYLIQFLKEFNYSACDVNPFSIEWARSEFQNKANIFLMDSKPPLALEEESMDFVFAWSIFSHYSESAHMAWLEELHRLMRPGGHLFITFQSEHLLNRMTQEKDLAASMRAESVDLPGLRRDYSSRGFGFYKCYQETEDDFGFDYENFGMAFIAPAYIRREWADLFEVVSMEQGGIANFQDAVLLRKPPAQEKMRP